MGKMKEEQKYSLWFMPECDIYRKLADIISKLSTEYSAPNFEPHITILHSLVMSEKEIIAKSSRLAAAIHPFEIKLNTVDYLDEYFRCLFIRVEETQELKDSNLQARKIFNRQGDPQYMPHLSLLYGHFPIEIKEDIIRKIGREFKLSFKVRSLHLFSSEEDIGKWHRIKEFGFR